MRQGERGRKTERERERDSASIKYKKYNYLLAEDIQIAVYLRMPVN